MTIDVDALAQFIRRIDGRNSLGAGALAERIVAWLAEQPQPAQPPEGLFQPQPVSEPTEAQIEAGVDAVPSFIGENYSLDTLRFLVREVLRAALAARDAT